MAKAIWKQDGAHQKVMLFHVFRPETSAEPYVDSPNGWPGLMLYK